MDALRPRAGLYYPRSTGEFQSWFATDADCLDYLDWLRWSEGFVCPRWGHAGGWAVADGRYKCATCGARTSVTAGTLFDRRRTPLTVWFTGCWMFAAQKDGISAQSLQRSLEVGSYPTAWVMVHRLRSVLVRPGRDRLTGAVEVDDTYIGGEEPGLRPRNRCTRRHFSLCPSTSTYSCARFTSRNGPEKIYYSPTYRSVVT